MKFKSVFVTGGAGYIGSSLVSDLLKQGYKLTVFDIMFFGDHFLPKDNPNLKIIKGDIRNYNKMKEYTKGHDAFVNLACISNDSSFELDEKLSKSINYDAFEPMVLAAKKSGIKRFIHASTSSVYGISNKKDVKEDHPLVPLSLYNKYKALTEPFLLKHIDANFEGVIIRPATVCGFAPRQRLDLSVNILTNHAVNKSEIKIFGGEQLRPNLHIKDYCDTISLLLKANKEKIQKQIFNVGYQNLSINDIAYLVKKVVLEEFPEKKDIKIVKSPSDDDKRSYHINSEKIKKILGFVPSRTIEMAVKDLCNAFKNGLLSNSLTSEKYFNVKKLKSIKAT